jgi:hypothetical protein
MSTRRPAVALAALTALTAISRAGQFDGPQSRDFLGNAPTGKRRDAGAFEYVP